MIEWICILCIGLILLIFPRLFSKIGWFNYDNMDGNEFAWEKKDKLNSINKRVINIYRLIGGISICISGLMLLIK